MMMNDLSLSGIDEDDALWDDQQQQAAQYNLSLYNSDISYGEVYDEDGFHAFYTSSEPPFGMQTGVQPIQLAATSTPVKHVHNQHQHQHPQQQKRQQVHVSQPQPQMPPAQLQCALCSRPNPSALLIPCSHKICTSCFTSSVNIVGEKSMKCSVPGCAVEVYDFKLVPASSSPTRTDSGLSAADAALKAPVPRTASGGHGRHSHTESAAELDFFQDMLDSDVVRSSTPRPSSQKDQTTIILRIDNVPWDITPPGLHAFFSLPPGVLARAHVLLDRKGKTLSHAFVEIKGEEWARAVLRGDYSSGGGSTSSRPGSTRPTSGRTGTVGGGSGVLGEGRRKRGVTITRGSMGELMTALFPSFKGTFDSTSGLPVVTSDTIGSRYPRYLFSMDEIRSMSALIKEPTQFVKSATLPIYALISVLGHVPAASSAGAGSGSAHDRGQSALGYVLGPDAVRGLEGAVRDAIIILKPKYEEYLQSQSSQDAVVKDDSPGTKADTNTQDTSNNPDATGKSTDSDVTRSAAVVPQDVKATVAPSPATSVKPAGDHAAPPPFKSDEVEVVLKELGQSVSLCRAFTSNQISSLLELIPASARPALKPAANPGSPSLTTDSSFDTPSFSRSREFSSSKRLALDPPSFTADGETEFVSAMSTQDLEFSLDNSVSFDSPYQPRTYSRTQKVDHHRDRSSSTSSSASASFQMDEGFSLPNLLQSHSMLPGRQSVGRMNQSYAGYPGQITNYPSTPAAAQPMSTPSPPAMFSPSDQHQSAGHVAPHPSSSYSHGRTAVGLGRRVPSTLPGLKRSEMRSASSMMAAPNMFAGESISPFVLMGMGGNRSMGMGMGGMGASNPNASVGPGVPPGLALRGGSGIKRAPNTNGARANAGGQGEDLDVLAREFGVGVDVVEALAKRLGGRNVTF